VKWKIWRGYQFIIGHRTVPSVCEMPTSELRTYAPDHALQPFRIQCGELQCTHRTIVGVHVHASEQREQRPYNMRTTANRREKVHGHDQCRQVDERLLRLIFCRHVGHVVTQCLLLSNKSARVRTRHLMLRNWCSCRTTSHTDTCATHARDAHDKCKIRARQQWREHIEYECDVIQYICR
jgi:hypothetical protein